MERRKLGVENVASCYPTGAYPNRYSQIGWYLLLWQQDELPADKYKSFSIPHTPWLYLLVPLWDKCTNWRALQASVYLDNTSWGLNPETIPSPIQPLLCSYERNCKLVANIFTESNNHTSNFTGSVIEMVGTFLVDWIHTRPSNEPGPNWTPLITTDSIEFSNTRIGCVLWECQCLLQESIANMDGSCKDMAAFPNLIMLFILGFPGTYSPESTNTSRNHQSREYSIEVKMYTFGSPFASQGIKVRIKEITTNGEMKTVMKLVGGNLVDKFMWADWIDAAMGYLKGADDAMFKNPWAVPETVRSWRKRTPLKCDLTSPLLLIPKDHPAVPDLPGDIWIWTGWPLFDIKVVQFEFNQWMEAAGLLRGFGEVLRPEVDRFWIIVHKEVERAEAGLLKITEWNRG